MSLPMGQDLSGWRLETWHELRLPSDEIGTESGGYFTDPVLAEVRGRGRGWYGSDGHVIEVHVLTSDGSTGYLLEDEAQITLEDQDSIRQEVVSGAKSKLSEGERKLLGVE